MKNIVLISTLSFLLFSSNGWADGYAEDLQPKPSHVRHHHRAVEETPETTLTPPPSTCHASSRQPKLKIVSWVPKQKVEKFLGEITECQTTQWDVIKMLAGPNVIGLDYPSEKEMWSYSGMWSYELKSPVDQTIVLMDNPGKRIRRYKNPVEMRIVFNEQDLVEKVEMDLVKN